VLTIRIEITGRDLGVLDPPGGARVLALHPDRVDTLFRSPVSSNTSTASGAAQRRGTATPGDHDERLEY
jgi:hypothetical protein